MKYLIEKDKQKRILFSKNEKNKIFFYTLNKDKRIPISIRIFAKLKLNSLKKRNFSKTRIKNRCIFTGRARGIFSFFRMSRLQIRELHLQGKLSGIKKSSW